MTTETTTKVDPKFFGRKGGLKFDDVKIGDIVICDSKSTTVCRVLNVKRRFFEKKDDFMTYQLNDGADIGDEMNPLLHLEVLGNVDELRKNKARTTFKTNACTCNKLDLKFISDLRHKAGLFIGFLEQLVPSK